MVCDGLGSRPLQPLHCRRWPMRSSKEMSWCPTSVARTYHRDETRDRLRTRVYDDGGLIVVVRVMPHRGTWEGHVQDEAVQVDGVPGGSARDVHWLNWR